MALFLQPDRALVDTTLCSGLILVFVVLAMTCCRQPAMRLAWGRMGLCAAVAMVAIRWLPAPFGSPFFTQSIPLPAGWPELAETPLSRLFIVANFAGLVGMVAWLLMVAVGARRLVRSATLPDAATRRLHRELDRPGEPPVRLLVSARVDRPVLLGVFRPVILLPAGLEAGGRETLRLMLIHERTHVARRDHLWTWLGAIAAAFWFYWPMTWWIRAQLRLDEEVLTDRESAERLGAPGRYASALVDLAEEAPKLSKWAARLARPLGPWTLPPAPLVLRVSMLARAPFSIRPRLGRLSRLTVAVVMLGCGALLGRVTFQTTNPATPAPTNGKLAASWLIPRLTIAPGQDHAQAAACLIDELPPLFDLRFEVDNQGRALREARVFGQTLTGPLIAHASDGFVPVRIVKDATGVHAWVGDVAVAPGDFVPAACERLTIEPPAHAPISIRNLTLKALANGQRATRAAGQ